MGVGTQPKSHRNEHIAFLHYDQGWSYEKIGKRYKITKQRVWQILHRDHRKKTRERKKRK
jgi:Mor family transcriptional regulator